MKILTFFLFFWRGGGGGGYLRDFEYKKND